MTARQYLDTALSQLRDTVWRTAAFSECWNIGVILSFYLFRTDSAFTRVLVVLRFLTSHTNVIRCALTVRAKVLLATGAANAELSHVIGRSFGYYITTFILLLIVGF